MDLFEQLRIDDPYKDFDASKYAYDLQGWNSQHINFGRCLQKYEPKLVVEVGSWKGGSAVSFGTLIKQMNLDCKLICVDTWLGSIEHRRTDEYKSWLKDKNGYPQIYYTFLANMVKHNLQDVVIPFPNASNIASAWFRERKILPDLVYIDGSHDSENVFNDATDWYNTVRTGGALIGDDYYCPEVEAGIRLFSKVNMLELTPVDAIQWMVEKRSNRKAPRMIDLISKDFK